MEQKNVFLSNMIIALTIVIPKENLGTLIMKAAAPTYRQVSKMTAYASFTIYICY